MKKATSMHMYMYVVRKSEEIFFVFDHTHIIIYIWSWMKRERENSRKSRSIKCTHCFGQLAVPQYCYRNSLYQDYSLLSMNQTIDWLHDPNCSHLMQCLSDRIIPNTNWHSLHLKGKTCDIFLSHGKFKYELIEFQLLMN